MKTCPYINQNDVHMRLNNTFCMYEGKLVFVTVNTTFDVGTITIYPPDTLSAAKARMISITDPKFSFVLPELGYLNTDECAVYLSKNPDRIQKQGLDSQVLRFTPHNKRQHLDSSVSSIVSSSYFQNMLDNKYPSLQEALHLVLEKKKESAAISKHVAIGSVARNMLCLFYDTRPIGMYNRKRGVFSITDERMPSLVLSRLNRLGVSYE